MVIAIDGPSGVGKTTVARGVAAALELTHLDTGATYRAATLAALRAGADVDDGAQVLTAVEGIALTLSEGRVLLDGEDVTAEIRSAEVTAAVSAVSAHPAVRELVVEIQRVWVAEQGGAAVVEGRDIGTVVFPQATVKVFLDASPEARASRRAGDAEASDRGVELVSAELAARDRADSTRDASPLQAAADARVIDTTNLSAEEVVREVLALIDGVAEETEDEG